MPAAVAIPLIAQAGTSALSGYLGARGAGNAADAQSMYTGQSIESVLGGVGNANTLLESAAAESSRGVLDTADQAATGVTNIAAQSGQNLRVGAAEANDLLRPYLDAGNEGLGALSQLLGEEFKFSEDDPSYQWRLQQGQKALERSAAAGGRSTGGGALKALTRYGQGMASQEYQNAFNRFQADRAQRGTIASGLAGLGYNAGNQMGRNSLSALQQEGDWNNQAAGWAGNARMNASQYAGTLNYNQANQRGLNTIRGSMYAGDALQQIGDIRGAGIMGRTNAWTGMVNGFGNAGGTALDRYFNGNGNTPDNMITPDFS